VPFFDSLSSAVRTLESLVGSKLGRDRRIEGPEWHLKMDYKRNTDDIPDLSPFLRKKFSRRSGDGDLRRKFSRY